MRKFMFALSAALLLIAVLLAVPLLRVAFDPAVQARDWRTAGSNSAGWAPTPEAEQQAVVQAYAAPAFGWRGAFADHCWIAVKPAGADAYTRYEVIGWNINRGRPAVSESTTRTPDQEWYGAKPKLLRDVRGSDAEKIIAALPAAVAAYPYPRTYTVWPGPNSNTFIAHLARELPDLKLALPGNALGKDYLSSWIPIAMAPSGTGVQFSIFGAFGVLLALHEGLEINVMGLVVGIDPMNLAVTVPGFGRLPAREDWTGD